MSDDRFIALRLPVAFLLSIVCLAAPAWADFKAGVDADNRTAIFTGPVIRFLDGDMPVVCMTIILNASASTG